MKKILTILIALVLSLPVFASCGQVSLTLDETSIELVMYEEYELQFKVKGAKKDDVYGNRPLRKRCSSRTGNSRPCA